MYEFLFPAVFAGNGNCFLFTLSPVMGVYLPSGYNENYMYLEQNAQTLPNGLVSGGFYLLMCAVEPFVMKHPWETFIIVLLLLRGGLC